MAICSDHGGYREDACKKCQEPAMAVPPMKLEGKGTFADPQIVVRDGPPALEPEDKLTISKLENSFLRAQQSAQMAQAQLQNFVRVMFEKYHPGAAYQLDLEKLEFVARGM